MFASVAGAARGLLRQPAFLVTAAGTLGLGIAAAIALFSAVNAALLTPLPYPRSGDIYSVRTFFPTGRFTSGLVGVEELEALRQLRDAVQEVAAVFRVDGAISDGAVVRQAVSYGASERFFDLFALPLAAGRSFAAEDYVRQAPRVIVLSHALWQSAFGGRPDAIGAAVNVGGIPARIVGIARPEFDVPAGADLWYNLYLPPTGIGHTYEGFMRMRPGVTTEAVRGRMAQAMQTLGRKYPDQDDGRAYAVRPLLDFTVGDLRPILLILLSATALLLALAAVNVSNLMLARSTARTREIAIRAALGASAARISLHLLMESVLLAAVGGIAGVALAYAGVRLMMRIGGARLPRLDAVPFDGTVVAVAAAVVLLTGIFVGIAPALRLSRCDIASLMNNAGRTATGSRRTRRLLAAFVVAEIAVAVALVAGAARLVRSFGNINRVDPGFHASRQIVIDVVHADRRYQDPGRMRVWWEAVETRLRAAGAAQAATTSSIPLRHDWDFTTFADLKSQPGVPPDQRPNGRIRFASPEFFSVMGITLVEGRAFTDRDRPGSPPVAIVNQAFVRRFLGDADPLRDSLVGFSNKIVDGKLVREDAAIVGVAADVRYASLGSPPEPLIYVPPHEINLLRQSIVVAPPEGRTLSIPALRSAILDVEPNVAIDVGLLRDAVSTSLTRERLGMVLMSLFGAAALSLAVIGVFGVIAYVVSQRTGELAVRQALGATRAQIFRMVLGDGGRVAAIGVAIGSILSWGTGTLMGRYLYQVGAADPLVLTASAIAVAAAALAAVVIPARRAAALEPARALRQA